MVNQSTSGPIERRQADSSQIGAAPTLLIIGAVVFLALPSAVLAFSSRLDGIADRSGAVGVESAVGAANPAVERTLSAHGTGKLLGSAALFRFTPAGMITRPDRSVTVAVRLDAVTAHAIAPSLVRAPLSPIAAASTLGIAAMRIAPSAYNLGIARGVTPGPPGLGSAALLASTDHAKPDLPPFAGYASGDGAPGPAPRLAPHIALDAHDRAGRAPRTFESIGTQTVDLGGSYRLGRNLDVTAGVRYSQDRDRLKPLPDGKSDTQAVFLGTQIRF